MRKNDLLKLMNDKKIKESNVLCIDVLKIFLQSEQIKRLNKDDDVSFKS